MCFEKGRQYIKRTLVGKWRRIFTAFDISVSVLWIIAARIFACGYQSFITKLCPIYRKEVIVFTESQIFPGGKGGRCVRLTTLPPSCAVIMKSGNLNFLEPSGPLQACNGTALPVLNLR